MRTGWVVTCCSCGLISASSWLALRSPVHARPIEIVEPSVRLEPLLIRPAAPERARVAEPTQAETLVQPPAEPVATEAACAKVRVVSPAEAERIARRYFHAQVNVEELESAMPADPDLNPRTPERFPGFFAAVAERDQLGAQLTRLPWPAPNEALPALALSAAGDDFARIYSNWSREDRLLENWRISRAVYAEAARVLDDRLTHGPYDTKPVGQLFAMG